LLNRITERVQITGGEKQHAEDTNG
jgi:hypothetical protein